MQPVAASPQGTTGRGWEAALGLCSQGLSLLVVGQAHGSEETGSSQGE